MIAVLNSYHGALGALTDDSAGRSVRLTGDALMIVFNDPSPCEEPAGAAVRLALALRDRVWELAEGWNRLGFELQLAAGISLGHATIGRIGSEQRWEYAPVGTVPTLAERLCESAAPGQILVSRRVFAATESSPSPSRPATSPCAASSSRPRPGTSSACISGDRPLQRTSAGRRRTQPRRL